MATISYSLSIAGTACPWKLGSGTPNTGSSGVLVPYNTGYWDGTAAGGGSAGQNAAYPYGKLHTHAGETSPTTLSVTPGQVIFLEYVSGTINTQGSGATSCGPAGVATTGLTPLPPGESDNETMPTNVIPGHCGINQNGTVNTSGTAVTWVSGTKFSGAMMGNPVIWINNVQYVITTVNSPTSITLASTAGTQTGVNYYFWGAKTNIGGIVGAFTDASGNVISGSLFDWASWGGINPPGAFTLTSVAAGTGTYQGTITGGASNAFVGFWFTVTGFTIGANNGTYYCTSSSAFAITLTNVGSIAEAHSGSAQLISGIMLRVPAGATTLSLGINDTQLYDNTGSFSVTAVVMDALGWTHDVNPFVQAPLGPLAGICGDLWGADQFAKLKSNSYALAASGPAQSLPVQTKLLTDKVGQLYPVGKN